MCALVLVATPPSVAGRTFRLRRLVVVGDSLLAGFGSGGLVGSGHPGQVDGAAAYVARRARVTLPLPLMSQPGVPPELAIVDANRNGRLDPGEVRRPSSSIGFRQDPDRGVRNFAVPGEDSGSVLETISPQDVAGELVSGNVDGRDILKFLILGLPLRDEPVSQVTRARDAHPSFLLVWIGNNDLLDMATRTDPNAVTPTPTEFGTRFRALLDALADTGADMAVANLPDPTGAALLRHAAPDVTSCRTSAGGTQPVAADDLLSIELDPSLLPVPPCARVLDAAGRTAVGAKVQAFNAEIAAAVAETEQRRGVGIALVDLAARFDDIGTNGVDIDGNGTPDLTTQYLGGVFSLDGIHPTRTGNALVANTFIEAIDARFGEQIPMVDVARVAGRDPLAHSRFRPAGEPPFGLISGDQVDAASYFDNVYGRIEQGAKKLGDRLQNIFGSLF
jgi:lysophospholipase L1-like esterase